MNIPKISALFESSLASALSAAGTTFTLVSATDRDGNALSGRYGFIIDEGSADEEFVIGTVSGTTVTIEYRGIDADAPNTEIAGNKKAHRRGASVKITDYPIMGVLRNLLNGEDTLPNKLSYASHPTFSANTELIDKKYADDLAIAGAPDASTTVKGLLEEATQAEIDADTAVGGTSARLAVNPSTLATSKYGTRLPSASEKTAMGNGGLVPSGVISPFAGVTAPTGWLLCDGAAVSRSTYAALFAVLASSVGTPTITIASPGVLTITSHGLATGDAIYLTTTGALPTGLTVDTRYWVVKIDANTFSLSTSLANALAGTKINTTGTQSGTHTATICPYGVGDGSTTFNLPNLKGNVPVGKNQSDTEFAGLGQTGGEKTHVLTIAELAAHTHTAPMVSGAAGANTGPQKVSNLSTTENVNSGSTGSDTAHNNLQPYIALNYLIKT